LIVNATGAWGDTTLNDLHVTTRRLFGGTKGSHFLIASVALRDALGDLAVYAETADGRFVFVLPFGHHVLVGTTDEPFSDDPQQAVARQDELDYLFELVHAVFPDVPLQRHQIVCHYSGVRPLPFAEDQAPGAVSRDHHIELTESDIPVLTLIGGKLTTSRQLGEQVANMVFEQIGCTRSASTRERVVPGGSKFPTDAEGLAERRAQLARELDCEASTIECLDALGGNLFVELFQGLGPDERTLVEGTQIPRGIVRWVIQNEWVRCLSDLVERRLMLVLTGQLTEHTLSELGQILVEENVIDAANLRDELTAYRTRLTEKYGCRW